MKKNNFIRFIEKYYLSGLVESVKWNIDNKNCWIEFDSEDKTLIGKISSTDVELDSGKLGVYNTSNLLKLISDLSEEIKIKTEYFDNKPVKLTINDDFYNGTYFALSDIEIIPRVGRLKINPNFNAVIKLNEEFIDKFIKSSVALSETNIVGIKSINNSDVSFIIGYSNINSNQRKINIKSAITSELDPILFSVEHIKNIFVSNKDMNYGQMKISSEGIMLVQFKTDNQQSNYYLVSLNG